MAYLRLSRAKFQYQCSICSKVILKGRQYYRVEPHPWARMRRQEEVKHLCFACVQGQEEDLEIPTQETRDWLRNYWMQDWSQDISNKASEPLVDKESMTIVETRVHLANITRELLKVLIAKPEEIYHLTPQTFEELICERLERMGFDVSLVGGHSLRKDGGIDIVAWPKNTVMSFLLAIQAKHHRSPKYKTGPGPVRELLGAIESQPFNAGLLVTNTTFTPDANWVAEQKPMLVRLRDIDDIKRWLEDNFLDKYDWREMPTEIVVCPGVVVPIPKPRGIRFL